MHQTFKSIVSSIQTATTSYFSPKAHPQPPLNQETSSPAPESPRHRIGMASELTGRKGLFSDVVYYDASSSVLNEKHRAMLTKGGAVEYIAKDDLIEWDKITHVFTTDMDFPGKKDSMKQPRIAVVTPRWIEISSIRNVPQNPNQFSPDPKMFFSGLILTCAELPEGDREAIFGGFFANGGLYDDVLRITTTHIIALNTDNEKCRRALKESHLDIKIVLPHWFDDCLKLRRRVDEKPYLLPDPPLFKSLAAQNVGGNPADPVPSDHLQYTHFGSIQNQTTPPESQAIIFKGNRKIVFLAKDLGVSARLRETLEHVVKRAGGKLVTDVLKCQVYIGSWREKEDYIQASRKGAVVGNLTWLYYMLANDRWISPRCHLLHYPLVRGGMSEMKNMVMTVTNYQGEARAYLEKLIEACGAKFTRNMTTSNTHLIAASKIGDKCKHAHDWGIDVVNHLWLEETYAKWQVQSVTIPRYTHFPPQTNLTEIVDKTEIQEEGIVDFFNPPNYEEDEYIPDANPVSGTTANGSKGNNVQSSYVPPEANTPAPVSRKVSPTATRVQGPQTPATDQTRVHTPGSSRRKAAEQAMDRLHNEIMPDVMLWQKEKNRKRIPEEPEDGGKKRKAEKRKHEEKENLVEGVQKKPRKDAETARDGVDTTSKITLLVTGASQDFLNANVMKVKPRMKIVTEGGFCTHLAAPHILRTEKFLCALPHAPTVVSLDWVEDCLEKDRVLDTKDYLLRDRENEKKYSTTLEQTVAKARENCRQLFKNYQIYISTHVPANSALVRIVEANGGECRTVPHTIKGRARVLRTDYLKSVENQVLVCTAENEDRTLIGKFKEEIAEGELKGALYTSEWIMKSVLRQEVASGKEFIIPS